MNIFTHTWKVLAKNERKQFITLALLAIIISVTDIVALVALLWIIRFYISPEASLSNSFIPGWFTDKNSVLPVAAFFLFFAVKNFAGYLITKAHYTFTGKVAIRISIERLSGYQHSPFSGYVDTDSSSLIRKIALQPFEFSQHVLSGLQQIITQLFLILVAIIAILIFNAKLFLLLLIILMPPVIVVFYQVKKRMTDTKKNLQKANERSYQYLLDALKGYIESNIYQRTSFFLNRYIQQRRQFSDHLFQSLSLQNLPGRIIEIFAVLGLFILIVIAKWSGDESANTFITIGAFMAAAYKIIPGIVKIINLSGQIKACEFSQDEMLQSAGKKNANKVLPANIDSLELKNISFQFPGQSYLLDNFSLSVTKRDFLGISGVSGKGKTTFLNILLGFLNPVSGTVLINEQPASSEEIKQYWPSISYIRQQSFFIYDTILQNIILQDSDYDKDNLTYALKVSGLDKLLETFPEGLDKIITENGKNISGGQQQRIALARALYKKSDLILLDEPFNELDDDSVSCILEQLRMLAAAGKIIIMITHDKQSLAFCNKTITLDEN
jgi:ABC-type bacteriocin/lantibiotic exporter with double-glycine peptidase domain